MWRAVSEHVHCRHVIPWRIARMVLKRRIETRAELPVGIELHAVQSKQVAICCGFYDNEK